MKALLRLAGELKRHLELLMAHLRWKDSFLLVGHFVARLYGFDTCGEELVMSLEEQQALNLLTCCWIEKMKCHGSEEAFLRRVSGLWHSVAVVCTALKAKYVNSQGREM